VVSAVVHGLLFAWLIGSSDPPTKPNLAAKPRTDAPVPVELLPPAERPAEPPQPLHRSDRIAESSDSGHRQKPDRDAFLGERDQTVSRETRAPRVGRFAEGSRGDSGDAPRARASDDGPRELAMSDLLALEDVTASAAAASDDALGDVPVGELTLLNTREYRYFSFYRRMKDALRSIWRKEVEQRNAALLASGKLVMSDELVTALRVELGEDGILKSANVVYSSGVDTFDDAALYAFRSVGRFPNPPAGMRGPDGVVRLRWEFVIYRSHGSGFRIARERAEGNRRVF
jgi:protein TonB